MKKIVLWLLMFLIMSSIVSVVQAAEPALGIHLLDPNELSQALELASGSEEQAGSVTVVLRTDDRDQTKWQKFFDLTRDHHVMPLVRLATHITESGWRRPTKKDIVEHAEFLSSLDWHSNELRVIAFNEPNHANEWGGVVDAEDYAQMLEFTLNWFHTEAKNYHILSAGLDAAAPNTATSRENISFIEDMMAFNPEIIKNLDGWTSHSYPNPGFSGSPYDTGKMSVRGYEHELLLLKKFSNRELDVYITETGWKKTKFSVNTLSSYYKIAYQKAWSDDRIKAVTPFVFAAYQGPFQDFSFVDVDGSPTSQYLAWRFLKQAQEKDPVSPILALLY